MKISVFDYEFQTMYGDLHFGHLSVKGSSLKPHSPQIATLFTGLKEFVNSDVFSIDFLMSAIFASLEISKLIERPPFRIFDNLLHSMISSLLAEYSSIMGSQ